MNEDDQKTGNLNVIPLPVDFQDGKPFVLTHERLIRIKMRMAEMSMDQATLSNATGLSNSAISQIMTGKIKKTRFMPLIAKALGVNMGWLLAATDQRLDMANWRGAPITEEQLPELLADKDFASSHVETVRTEGVLPQQVERRFDVASIAEIDLNQTSENHVKGIPVQPIAHAISRDVLRAITSADAGVLMLAQGIGSAMEPLLNDGDVVFFDTSRRVLDCLDAVWLMRYAGMMTVRRARKAPDGIRLMADNPNLPDILAGDGEVEFFGKLAGVLRKF